MALNHGTNQTLEGIREKKSNKNMKITATAKGTIKINEKRMLMTKACQKCTRFTHSLQMNWLRACASTSDRTMQKMCANFFSSQPTQIPYRFNH